MSRDWRIGKDVRGCKTAVIQALFYHFKLSNGRIAKLTNAAPQNVSALTVSSGTAAIPWFARRHQARAIELAQILIQHEASRESKV